MAGKSTDILDKILRKKSPWERIEQFDEIFSGQDMRNIRGKCFEALLEKFLIEKSITPFYREVELVFIDNCRYDIVLFEENIGVFSLSAKVSLRERWKQSEHEARLLRSVYPKSENYLITLGEKIPDNKTLIGLDGIVRATSPKFKRLLADMGKRRYSEAKNFNQLKNPAKARVIR